MKREEANSISRLPQTSQSRTRAFEGDENVSLSSLNRSEIPSISKMVMHRRRRRRDLDQGYSDKALVSSSNEPFIDPLDSTESLTQAEMPALYSQEPQRDAGWQLRPNVSDSQSMIIGASVSASLIVVMLLVFCICWYRCHRKRRTEGKSRRSLWASTLWKRGRRNEASFVPLDDRHNRNNDGRQVSFITRIVDWRKTKGPQRSNPHLSPYPCQVSPSASTVSFGMKVSMRAPSDSPQMMEKSNSLESIVSLDRDTKRRITYQHYHPSPTLAPPPATHASPHLKSASLFPTNRGSYKTSVSAARSSDIRYKDVMPNKSSMSMTEGEPATSSTVCGLGLDLDICEQDDDQMDEREVFNGFRQWHAPSPRQSEILDDRLSDASSMLSFELAEVSGVIKPCFTIERIEEFTGPIYADQIASALVEARMVSSSSFSSNISASTADSNGDLSALFKETMAMLQKKPTLLRRSQVVGAKAKTRTRSKTCPDDLSACLIKDNRQISSEGRDRPMAVASQKQGQGLQWHLCLSPERYKGKQSHKSKQLSKLMANIHLPGASIDSLGSDDSQHRELIPNCPTRMLFQEDIAKIKKESNPFSKAKRRESNSTMMTTSTSASSWDVQSFNFPSLTSSPGGKQRQAKQFLQRSKSTEKVDWRSSDYHSPTLQVFHLYQDDDASCFSELDEAQAGDLSDNTI